MGSKSIYPTVLKAIIWLYETTSLKPKVEECKTDDVTMNVSIDIECSIVGLVFVPI